VLAARFILPPFTGEAPPPGPAKGRPEDKLRGDGGLRRFGMR